jgi:predicted kinase
MHELAGHIADFHAMAERRYDFGGAAALTAVARTNHRSCRSFYRCAPRSVPTSRRPQWTGQHMPRENREWPPKRAVTSPSQLDCCVRGTVASWRSESQRIGQVDPRRRPCSRNRCTGAAQQHDRQAFFGVAPETRLSASADAPEVSSRVYEALRRRAVAALAAGYSVIIGAVSLKPEQRQSFAAVAKAACVPFSRLWLAAPASEMERRIRARLHDASNASLEVLAQQLRQEPGRSTGLLSMPAVGRKPA